MLAAATGAADAAVAGYTSSIPFYAALADRKVTIQGFEGAPSGTPIASGSAFEGLVYSFPSGTVGRIDDEFRALRHNSLALDRKRPDAPFFLTGEKLTVEFATAVDAIGIFFNIERRDPGQLFVATNAGRVGNGSQYDFSSFYFIGLIAETPFTSAVIGSVATGGARLGFNLDNLAYAPHVVPVPGTFILFGSGLALLARRRWPKAASRQQDKKSWS